MIFQINRLQPLPHRHESQYKLVSIHVVGGVLQYVGIVVLVVRILNHRHSRLSFTIFSFALSFLFFLSLLLPRQNRNISKKNIFSYRRRRLSLVDNMRKRQQKCVIPSRVITHRHRAYFMTYSEWEEENENCFGC